MRPELPSGTVTFLFTDVEGSTKLLSELGEEGYADALAEHRRVIREACAAEGGVEVDTQGDAFFFAFPTAPGALAAAGALIERLAADGPIRVRVGLHTGTPLLGEEGYVGHDVHRAARIAASGHGGQVLVSASTASLVKTGLTDLGEHRFKDLGAPERVFQFGASDFPPLKTLYRTNLPVSATPFLGREQELSEVASLLSREDARLVTLTGPGGTGKTRLSLQAAAEASDGFPDGIFWIPLAPLRDPSLLETTLAQVLEVQEQPGTAITDTIAKSFASRSSLLVLDNCEHLADAVAALLRTLLEHCPALVVAASSRERLGLRSERVYPVPPMASPDGELLFRERALAVLPDFVPDEHVASICEAVDWLPLAIELAAARVRSLSTQAIRERLSERLSLLTSRDRDLEERQRTLEATIAWSYDLLDGEEQRVLRGLSVFAGGCTLEAAEAVAGADLDLLESLLDKSLLRHRIGEAGQDRYWMLETIREYAAARLAERNETDERADAHRAFFASLAGELDRVPGRLRSAAQLAGFRADRDNFRVALLGAIGAGDAESAFRIVRHLIYVWQALSEVADGYAVAQRVLALEGGEVEDRAYVLVRAGRLAIHLGHVTAARALLDEAESLLTVPSDTARLSEVERHRAFLEFWLGNSAEAVAHGERALALAVDAGDVDLIRFARGAVTWGLLLVALETDPPDARMLGRALETQVELLEEVRNLDVAPDVEAERRAWIVLPLTLLERYGEALEHEQEALRLLQGASLPEHDPAFSADGLALRRQALASAAWLPEHILIAAFSADGLALRRQALALAAWALRALAEQGREMWAILHLELKRLETNARATLGDEGYEAAVREGEAMTVEQAVELVLSLSADG